MPALSPTGTPSRAGIQQAIEDAITKRVQRGVLTTATIPSGSVWTIVATVVFTVPFDTTPSVVAQVRTAYGGSDVLVIQAVSETPTGFQIRARCASALGAQSVAWIAATDPPA